MSIRDMVVYHTWVDTSIPPFQQDQVNEKLIQQESLLVQVTVMFVHEIAYLQRPENEIRNNATLNFPRRISLEVTTENVVVDLHDLLVICMLVDS
jgi:hypothetical protein